jgi:hypothetical protein
MVSVSLYMMINDDDASVYLTDLLLVLTCNRNNDILNLYPYPYFVLEGGGVRLKPSIEKIWHFYDYTSTTSNMDLHPSK